MREHEGKEKARKVPLDFDDLKLWRGEVGPNVAADLLEK